LRDAFRSAGRQGRRAHRRRVGRGAALPVGPCSGSEPDKPHVSGLARGGGGTRCMRVRVSVSKPTTASSSNRATASLISSSLCASTTYDNHISSEPRNCTGCCLPAAACTTVVARSDPPGLQRQPSGAASPPSCSPKALCGCYPMPSQPPIRAQRVQPLLRPRHSPPSAKGGPLHRHSNARGACVISVGAARIAAKPSVRTL
jgi:hypothetical protein